MREQVAAHREKILDVAGTRCRERGFDGIGVADIIYDQTAALAVRST